MLRNISWSDFILTILATIFIYYLIFFFIYHRNVINNIRLPQFFRIGIQNLTSRENQIEGNRLPEVISNLLANVKSNFEEYSQKQIDKKELISSIHHLIREYPSLRSSGLQNSINVIIQEYCKNICSIVLSEAELKMLWAG
jgi:hypothetical protein